ncbi:MAG: hypothetical protein HYV63_33510 [Candidatus Schekmanbacteria bacterium]|nr:hypothetical protein [Candidatus Schekmanbacteria bacterium]
MTEITSGIAALITRIKNEGVSAGEEERDRIIAEARQRAEQIVADARNEVAALRSTAEADARRVTEQMRAELKMAARDFVLGFQERIRQQIIRPVLSEQLRGVLTDETFLSDFVARICADFLASGGDGVEISVSEDLREKLAAATLHALAAHVDAGKEVAVRNEEGLVGFRLIRRGEAFAWDFSLEALTQALARLVEPHLRQFFELPRASK